MTIFDRRSSSHRDSAHRPRRTNCAPRRRFAPALDPLEGRALLSNLVVTDNHDSGPGSLRQAIQDAHSGDTIAFAPNLRGETITLTSGELDVSKSLAIDGPGADQLSVSGDDSSRVFKISQGANVSISGLTITDGEAAQGGGIFNSGTLTLEHCDVAANRVVASTSGGTMQGGGIYSAAAALTILNSTLSDNQADGGSSASGSGGNGQGGGIYYAPSGSQGTLVLAPLTITDSTLAGNQAIGGATGSDFNFSGVGQGGGIMVLSGSTVTIAGCTINGNEAVSGGGVNPFLAIGGAIYNAGPVSAPAGPLPAADLALTDALIIGNLAQRGDAGEGDPDGSSGPGTGGGIYLASGGTATLRKTVVAGNHASTSNDNIYGSYTTT